MGRAPAIMNGWFLVPCWLRLDLLNDYLWVSKIVITGCDSTGRLERGGGRMSPTIALLVDLTAGSTLSSASVLKRSRPPRGSVLRYVRIALIPTARPHCLTTGSSKASLTAPDG